MPAGDLRELASYLVKCSSVSLGEFLLRRLDRASHLERNLHDLVRELTETLASAELAEFLRTYGEEIIAATEPRAAHVRVISQNAEPPTKKLADEDPLCQCLERQSKHRPPAKNDSQQEYGRCEACECPQFTPVNYWHDPVKDRRIRINDFFAAMTIRMNTDPKTGWTWKMRLSQLAYGKTTDSNMKRLFRRLRAKGVIDTKGDPGDEDGQQYRLLPKFMWLPLGAPKLKSKAVTPRPRRQIKLNLKAGAITVWADGRKATFPVSSPRLILDPGTGDPVYACEMSEEGSFNMNAPAKAKDNWFKVTPEVDTGCKSAPTPTPGANLHPPPDATTGDTGCKSAPTPTPGANLHPPPDAAAADTRCKSAPTPPAGKMIWSRIPVWEGHIFVEHETGVNPYTARERRTMVKNHQGQPRVEDLDKYFRDKSFNTKIEFRPDWKGWPKPAPKSAPKTPSITQLRSGPSKTWDRALVKVETLINPHSFSTWFRPTKEEGISVDGEIVVRVPTRLFKRRMVETYGSEIRGALKAIGEGERQVKFITDADDSYEFVPPGSQTVDEYSKTIAKGGTR